MKAVLQLLLVLILSQGSFNTVAGRYTDKTIKRAVKLAGKSWKEDKNVNIDFINAAPIVHSKESAYYSPYDTIFSMINETGGPIGFLVISSAKGRYDYFDFMLVYNLEKQLIDIRILTYRSEHGSQVTSRSWLRRFTDLNTSDTIRYGVEIDALSGATFSASSLTLEVDRINGLIREL
jgi:hypothetical protein